MAWIFGNLDKNENGEMSAPVGDTILGKWGMHNLGRIVMLGPLEAYTKIDYTGAPGATSGIYYSLCFQLRKWEMQVFKASESIDVSPMHSAYYQLTMKQKEELEARIKSGLASVAQTISDYELLKHDERKYLEFKHYAETKDEHSLRAVFIDQVDAHTGEGVSMRTIVSRWPTLISDFMRLTPDDTDPDKLRQRLGISKAEAVVLVTKNKLYNEWKSMFMREVEQRLERIQGLVRARENSIEEYRNWLKPYIARFKMLEQSFETPGGRAGGLTSFVRASGHAVSSSQVKLWVWKDFQPTELKRFAPELMAEKPVPAYDDWLKKNVIFHPEWGLVTEYPWITGRDKNGVMWADKTAKEIIDSNWMIKKRLYYGFMEITFNKGNVRMPSGSEIEDGVFTVNGLLMSQNALLAKLMELKAKEEELEHYISDLLGIKPTLVGRPYQEEKVKLTELEVQLEQDKTSLKDLKKRIGSEKDKAQKAKLELERARKEDAIVKIEKDIGEKKELIGLMEHEKSRRLPWGMTAFRPAGPYERNFEERVAKYFAKAVAENFFVPTVSFLKEKIGFGKP